MTIKTKTILFSASACMLLLATIILFFGYRAANQRFYRTASSLEMVHHAVHEITLEMLLNLSDVHSLKQRLNNLSPITRNLENLLSTDVQSDELVKMGISIVRIKRVIDHLVPGQPIAPPLQRQLRNEVVKISDNVKHLKESLEEEMAALQADAETKITSLLILFVVYVLAISSLFYKHVILPLLAFSNQVGLVRQGEMANLPFSSEQNEIGSLINEFHLLIDQNKKGEQALREEIVQHKEALDKVKLLSGFLPICASCKQVRDDQGYWNQIETYIRDNSDVEFSHSICPDCAQKLYPQFVDGSGQAKKGEK